MQLHLLTEILIDIRNWYFWQRICKTKSIQIAHFFQFNKVHVKENKLNNLLLHTQFFAL